MAGKQDSVVVRQILNELSHRADLVGVEPYCGLVQNNQMRLVHESIRKTDSLLKSF